MTESEIRSTIDALVRHWHDALSPVSGEAKKHAEEALINLGIKLAAQLFVDLHRIADAAEALAYPVGRPE